MFPVPIVGVLIASRQPRNPIGWIMLAIGFVWEFVVGSAGIYVQYGLVLYPGSLVRPDLVAVLTASSWVPGIGLIATFLILLFPDGHLPSPRWTWLAWACGLVLVYLTVLLPLIPGLLSSIDPAYPRVPNPLGIESLRSIRGPLFSVIPVFPVLVL